MPTFVGSLFGDCDRAKLVCFAFTRLALDSIPTTTVPSTDMTPSQIIRVAFGYLALSSLQIGAWALFAPRSFYDGFPGAGRSWVSVDGPYNEHLVRDVGALNLAIAVLLVALPSYRARRAKARAEGVAEGD